jgi:hypothetical protein
MIGFWLVNLIVPGAPEAMDVRTPSGIWTIEKSAQYLSVVTAIANGQCGETYAIEHPVSLSAGASVADAVLGEMIPLVLGASYLTGLSVTSRRSLPGSEIMMMQPGDKWPRERAMGDGNAAVNDAAEFVDLLEIFVAAWAGIGQRQKILLLIHHWLDSLSCCSFEDLYLSATTLLQIIVATEATAQGFQELRFLPGITAAANRAGIRVLSSDFKDMRNVLVHEGKITGGRFYGTTRDDCADVVSDVLNWFDEYVHAVIGLGNVRRQRFRRSSFRQLNAFSI